jgi:CheY-like chemotaxis protein
MVRTFEILNARILIVDDQESHVLLLERMLRDAGYSSVESTTDPAEVCKLHRQNRYAAILLDLKMPVMDGFQVMEQLKEAEGDENFPVLVITAEPGHKLRALRAGARDFVSKPLDMPEVLIRVHNMIELRLMRLEMDLLRAQLVDAQKDGVGATPTLQLLVG